MRKLLDEAQHIDRYLLRRMTVEDKLVFQAQMLTNTALRENVHAQQQAHRLITLAGRATQREQLNAVFNNLITTDTTFQAALAAIFK
ncbi:MAG TPA: hypothetical protein VFS25_02550 [Chitinophaga sp.]|uniref:hypothetical protein n=1 Tax=Chitinophaga sp. TaxID=1869181 RepID=UPI002DBE73A9|nr:hypothetical protein [Chitinophaga sp.]HEU4551678.1 hypothetical protein [Chitinophaga sp.]